VKKHILTDAEAIDIEIADAALRATEIRYHISSVTHRLAARLEDKGMAKEMALAFAEAFVGKAAHGLELKLQDHCHPLGVQPAMLFAFKDCASQLVDGGERAIRGQIADEVQKQADLKNFTALIQ